MEVINPSKAAAARKRGAGQQAPAPASQHTFDSLKLERVYGSGSCTAAALACPHPVIPGLLAYTCGGVVVLYDSQYKQQTAFFSPRPRRSLMTGKPYSCLAFSRDGAYLAAGERTAQGPEILVWEVTSNRCLQALRGHKHGVGSVAFSHDGRLLVSTGESYDGQLCVWDWQAGVLLAKQHTQAEVQRACFAEELSAGAAGLTITTVGKAGHFKVWSLTLPGSRGTRDGGHLAAAGQASLVPRPASLKEYRSHNFVGVAAGIADGSAPQAQPLLYALTQNGVLLTLRPATRTIDKSLSLQVPAAFALAVSSGLIACACAAGVVRLFATRTLAFKGNLPRPSMGRSTGGAHPDAAGGGRPGSGGGGYSSGGGGLVSGPAADPQASAGSLFPDAVGCAFDSAGERLTVVYADRSLMIWDVRNPARVTRMRSVLSHSGVVWGAVLIPPWQAALLGNQGNGPPTPGGGGESGGGGTAAGEAFGPSSVLCTCGADGTIRLWNVCLNNSASTAGPLGVPADMACAAKVTRTLRAIIHASQPDGAAAGAAAKPVALRCLRVSPCGRHLATGDARGNLRVYDLTTLQLLKLKEAHDAEILSLDYSPPSLDGTCYLVSGSRDAFVHVYDMSRGYELVGTCDAHGGPVTAVHFSAHSAHGGRLALLSCSADKSVVFRLVQLGSCGLSFDIYHTERVARGVLYDMAVDPSGGRAVVVGQDNQLRLFDVATGRALRNFSGDTACGEAVAVVLDSSGHLAICSCADGSVAVYDVDAGVLLARGSGHADVCTGAVLLEDHRGLVTVGGDGCALLWRLTPRLAQRMQDAAAECRRQMEQQAAAQVEMLQQRQHQMEREREQLRRLPSTPTARRRKAWDLGGAADGGAAAAASGGGQQEGGAGGPVGEAEVDAMDEDVEEEPQQVHVDFSATIRRVREGKPLLSLEKLPKWAQRTHSPEGLAGGDPEAATAGHAENSHRLPRDHAAPSTSDANDTSDVVGGIAAVAALLPPPAPAGVWAQRVALPPPTPPPAAAAAVAADPEPPGAAAAAAAAEAEPPPAPFAGAAAATMMAAAVASLATQPRTWAEVVEEDDEIVFCDSLDDGPVLGDPRDVAAEPPPLSGDAAAFAAAAAAAAAAYGQAPAGAPAPAGLDDGDAAAEEGEGSPRSPEVPEAADAEEGPASGCASNRVGEPPTEEEGAAAAADGDAVRRDLFREHFDSLGLDQGSATKAPPPDPRRLSFTQVFRQARASSAAGSQPDGSNTPLRGTGGGAGGSDALPPPMAAAEPVTTPYLSRLPLPPGVNASRGGGGAALFDADGAVTSAAWTPERAMLPLTSPALARTDKQLKELERIRLRLLSTLRKRQTNEEAALGTARPATAGAAAAATAPMDAPAAAVGGSEPLPQLAADGAASAPDAAAAPEPVPEAEPAPQQPVDADAAPEGDAGEPQAREPAQSAGGFLLPPPPAYTPVGPHQRASAAAAEQPPESPPAGAQPSPGFSSLTAGTPMLGQGDDAAAWPAAVEGRGGDGTATGEDAASRLFVFNPIYGASPTTPAMGAAAAEALQRAGCFPGASPRCGDGPRRVALSAAGDGGPASSPADSSSAAGSAAPADDVIRAVLESEGGCAAAVDDAVAAASGVCVVVSATTSGSKEPRRAAAAATTGEADSAATAAATTPESSPAKGSGTPRRSKIAQALPPMKPKTGSSPAKSLGSVGAISSASAGPVSAGVRACAQEPEHGAAGTVQASALAGSAPPDADDEALLSRMELAVRDFAAAYRRRTATSPTFAAAAPAPAGSAASRFQAAAASAMAELSKLLHGQGVAGQQQQQLPKARQGQGWQGQQPGEESQLPPAVACASPQLSQELLSRPTPGSRLVRAGASVVSASGMMGRMGSACSSQVVVEMGLVESMVEEKLQARMREEMQRVEESVMQRVMQTMAARQQLQQ